jgi:predicted O-methyltransferase YrrM
MRLSEYYRLSNGLKRLRHASLDDMRRWVSTLPAVGFAPPPMDVTTAVCQVFPGTTRSQAKALQSELATDDALLSTLDAAMKRRRGHPVRWQDWHPFLYAAVRVSRPNVVLETGVFDGLSSALILRAMERNDAGELISIDLPAHETIAHSTDRMLEGTLPQDCCSGWIVPDFLRSRYHLRLGDSRKLLTAALVQYKRVDIFLHDSLHTYQHQMFEYNAAWPRVKPTGLLLSDDIFWTAAFHRFCKQQGVGYVNAGDVGGFGVVRKPANGFLPHG